MTVKRFIAPDMRRALDLVRQEMGPDAIILSSKRVKDGVEVLTAEELDLPTRGYDSRQHFSQQFDTEVDRPLSSDHAWNPQGKTPASAPTSIQGYTPPPATANAARASQLAQEIEAARERMLAAKRGQQALAAPIGRTEPSLGAFPPKPAPSPRIEPHIAFDTLGDWAEPNPYSPKQDGQLAGLAAEVEKQRQQTSPFMEDPRVARLQEELAEMRSQFQQHLNSLTPVAVKPTAVGSASHQVQLNNQLSRLGLPAPVCDRLATAHGHASTLTDAWRNALNSLVSQLPTPAQDPIQQGGIFAFVGPTGVGKTTTIAKLAARAVLTHGADKVALVTTDTFRVGAQDQLRALGRVLNVPVRVVDQNHSLNSVLQELSRYPLVLMDTAGFRQGDPLLKAQEALLAANPRVEHILVMAANSQCQTLKATAHAYKSSPLAGCILTKIDETLSLGEALGVLIQQQLSLLFTTHGQDIPKDIALAHAQQLVMKAVSLAKQGSLAPEQPQIAR